MSHHALANFRGEPLIRSRPVARCTVSTLCITTSYRRTVVLLYIDDPVGKLIVPDGAGSARSLSTRMPAPALNVWFRCNGLLGDEGSDRLDGASGLSTTIGSGW